MTELKLFLKKNCLLVICLFLFSGYVNRAFSQSGGGATTDENVLPSTGNIGIGTRTPSTKLEVIGTSELKGDVGISGDVVLKNYTDAAFKNRDRLLSIDEFGKIIPIEYPPKETGGNDGGGGSGGGSLSLSNTFFNSFWKATGNDAITTSNFVGTLNDAPIIFKTYNIERLRLTSDGNLGLGVPAPLAKLDVNGGIRTSGRVDIGGNLWLETNSNISASIAAFCGDLVLSSGSDPANSDVCSTDPADIILNPHHGRVGIGTSTPAKQLHIRTEHTSTNINTGSTAITSSHGSHYGIRLQDDLFDEYNTLITSSVWDIEPKTSSPSSLQIGNHGVFTAMTLFESGKVGFGTTTPVSFLHLKADDPDISMDMNSNNSSQLIEIKFKRDGTIKSNIYWSAINENLYLHNGGHDAVTINNMGNVGIGYTNASNNYKLAVNGTIRTRKVEVTIDNWSDFVFNDGYRLLPLQEVEKFIQSEKHLPGVPSEKEVLAKGVDLGSMDAILLQKIEELTLYIIAQEKKIQSMDAELKALKKD